MSTYRRKLFLIGIGLIAGLAAWPAAELTLWFQGSFPSYLIFSITLGVVFGVFIGCLFGSGDGIMISDKRRVFYGARQGLLIGAVGGMAGFFVGQAALFIIGEYIIYSKIRFNTIGLPLSRALGWACLGVFIGMIDGIRTRSFNKIKVGIVGGVLGGAVGGLALEYLRLLLPGIAFARLLGLVLFGMCIGLLYGMIENRLSFGVLTLLNGKYKGRDFLISQHYLSIGSSGNNDIVLEGYKNIAAKHASVTVKEQDILIKSGKKGQLLFANDDRVREHVLKLDDIIRIGSAKLMFHYK